MGTTDRGTFYDQHPFDWAPSAASSNMATVVARPLAELINRLDVNCFVLDVGCGAGRVLGFLAKRGIRCIGVDRSRVSVRIAVDRYACPGAVADNLRLPFADAIADVVISDGVIHHTDDPLASFAENCRVLKPGGQMYMAVYKPSGRYPFLYKYPGALIRRGLQRTWARPLVLVFAQIPYFLFHFLRSKGQRTWTGALNLFYDYFVTPCVAFVPRQAVELWSKDNAVRLVHYDENPGSNVHSFVFQKNEPPKSHFNHVVAANRDRV
jgi:SAM-dependent methyltransferase